MITYRTKKEDVLKLTHPCRCPKCHNTCNFGSGVLADDDLQKIAEFLDISQDKAREKYFEEIEKFNTVKLRPKLLREDDKPYGRCIFFDDIKGCIIHKVKPLECKIAMSCKSYGDELIQWFDINHFLNLDDPESIRQFIVYEESGGETLGLDIRKAVGKKMLKRIQNYEDLKPEVEK